MNIQVHINPAIPRCPRCRAKDMIKKDTRKTMHEVRQRWGCNRCGHTFINQVTKHSRYPMKVIMEGIGRYNLGYSGRETVRYPKGRFGLAVPEKTFRLWYMAHKPICTQTESSFCLCQCGCKSTAEIRI
jgi:hypothetical protein